jgi:hypothetical protein
VDPNVNVWHESVLCTFDALIVLLVTTVQT